MVFLKNASMCAKKVKLFNHDCLPILILLHIMQYIMFAALSNSACLYNIFLQKLFVFMLCIGLLTCSLFTSSMIIHHAQCF